MDASELTAFFTDICDSTKLYEAMGNQAALAEVQNATRIIREEIERNEGRVVKLLGDGVLATFESPADAFSAAQAINGALFLKSRLAVRTGFHHGPVVLQGGDVFGDAVNVAARLAGVASRGQVLTSQSSQAALPKALRARTRELGSQYLKGKEQPVPICELVLQATDELTLIMQPVKLAEPQRLRLELRGEVRFLGAPIRRLAIGRSPQADIVVSDPRASRIHLVLEQRGEQFVLQDQSSNGTFVLKGGRAGLRLMRQEYVLEGEGQIAFGPPDPDPNLEAVRVGYRVERA